MSSEGNAGSAGGSAGERGSLTGRVFVTGGTGFVGRAVVRELVGRGHKAVCLVRDQRKLEAQTAGLPTDRVEAVEGNLFDSRTARPRSGALADGALAQAAEGAQAAIHLVGIIAEQRLRGQTFERIHVEGTQRVVEACRAAGVSRFIHMSAMGARPEADCQYHATKWAAECIVRDSGLDWTIFRPSVIHGPDGDFMRLMRLLACGLVPPVVPYFGDGLNKIQPVSVLDVAHCCVAALSMPETIGQAYDLGGPEEITWKELYRICRQMIPGAKSWKPVIGQPVPIARLLAATVMKLPIVPSFLRFNLDQVQMSQEDAVCDIGPVEEAFGIKLRDFREELAEYASSIV